MIYFIRCGEFVKIGRANDVTQRISALQTGNPYEVELMGAFDGSDSEERRLHAAFAPFHHRAEWFFLTKTIRAFIEQNAPFKTGASKFPKRKWKEPNRDSVRLWHKELVIKRSGYAAKAARFRVSYEAWCKDMNVAPVNPTAFGRTLREEFGIEKEGKGRVKYVDVDLRPERLRVVA